MTDILLVVPLLLFYILIKLVLSSEKFKENLEVVILLILIYGYAIIHDIKSMIIKILKKRKLTK
jgi:hypothetical protein